MLLVHGYPTSSWDWSRIWDALASRRRVIAGDMLGFGLSDKPASGYSIRRQADLQQARQESERMKTLGAAVAAGLAGLVP